MLVIAFAPRYNIKRADATGAFQPEGRRFLTYWQQDPSGLILVDNRKSASYQSDLVLDVLAAHAGTHPPEAMVAFFCHGYRSGIQLGFKLRQADELARAIAAIGDDHVRVPLYACDTGRDLDGDRNDDLEAFGGDGGFADTLRDQLCMAGATCCRVDAHTTAGHTSRNPNVRRFEGQGLEDGGTGGAYIVPHGNPMWSKWRLALRTDLRFRFPAMTVEEIYTYLATQ